MNFTAHRLIMESAYSALPSQMRSILEAFRSILLEASNYPDIFDDPNKSIEDKNKIDPRWAVYCCYPIGFAGPSMHKWPHRPDKKDEIYPMLLHLLENSVSTLVSNNMEDAAKFLGCLSHYIADAMQPAHLIDTELFHISDDIHNLLFDGIPPAYPIDTELMQLLSHPPIQLKHFFYHRDIELLTGSVDKLQEPQLLGYGCDEAAETLALKIVEAHTKDCRRYLIPLLRALYAEDMEDATRLVSAPLTMAAQLTLDMLYTTVNIAIHHSEMDKPIQGRKKTFDIGTKSDTPSSNQLDKLEKEADTAICPQAQANSFNCADMLPQVHSEPSGIGNASKRNVTCRQNTLFIDIDGTITMPVILGNQSKPKTLLGQSLLHVMRDEAVRQNKISEKDAEKIINDINENVKWWHWTDFILALNLDPEIFWKSATYSELQYLRPVNENILQVIQCLYEAGFRMIVTSNNPSSGILLKLRIANLCPDLVGSPYFLQYLGATELRCMKNHPEFWRRALAHTGLSSKDVITIGDSWNDDIITPRQVGICKNIYFDHIRNGIPENILPSGVRIAESWSQIESILLCL